MVLGKEAAKGLRAAAWTMHEVKGACQCMQAKTYALIGQESRREEKEWKEELHVTGRVKVLSIWKKKCFWPTDFIKQIVKHRCKNWVHLKEVELKSIKVLC